MISERLPPLSLLVARLSPLSQTCVPPPRGPRLHNQVQRQARSTPTHPSSPFFVARAHLSRRPTSHAHPLLVRHTLGSLVVSLRPERNSLRRVKRTGTSSVEQLL